MTKQESIIWVHFFTPPFESGRAGTDFFFGSLAAIYEWFTPEQIGCTVNNLWNIGIDFGRPYLNQRCTISKEMFVRKSRKTPLARSDKR